MGNSASQLDPFNKNSEVRKGLRNIDPTNKNSNLTKAVSRNIKIPIKIVNRMHSPIYVKLTGEGSNEYYRIDYDQQEVWSRRLGRIDVYLNKYGPQNAGAIVMSITNGSPGTNTYEWTGNKLERRERNPTV